MLVMWMADQITTKGIGNGISMIIFAAAKRKRYEKNAVATPSNSALRNLFPRTIN